MENVKGRTFSFFDFGKACCGRVRERLRQVVLKVFDSVSLTDFPKMGAARRPCWLEINMARSRSTLDLATYHRRTLHLVTRNLLMPIPTTGVAVSSAVATLAPAAPTRMRTRISLAKVADESQLASGRIIMTDSAAPSTGQAVPSGPGSKSEVCLKYLGFKKAPTCKDQQVITPTR